jgi:hypothetical protein
VTLANGTATSRPNAHPDENSAVVCGWPNHCTNLRHASHQVGFAIITSMLIVRLSVNLIDRRFTR